MEENRSLKCVLNDTQTNIALLRAEMNQIRHQYENKCSELSEYVLQRASTVLRLLFAVTHLRLSGIIWQEPIRDTDCSDWLMENDAG